MRTRERPIPQEEVRRVLENRKIPRKRKYLRRAIKLLTYQQNSLFTANVRVGLSSRADNINCLILGGAGTGKSRSFIIPNLIQMNCNPVITDPKGEILKKTGQLLKDNGYDVRVLDLIHHDKSHCYNPFAYFRSDDEILMFVNNMWAAMEDKTAQKGEQIWDDQAKNVMMSLCLYLYHFAPPQERNMDMVIHLFNQIDTSEQKKDKDPIDLLFGDIEDKTDTAYTYYSAWSTAKGVTLASICATFSAKMSVFNLNSMKQLTYTDEIGIPDLARKKVAVYMIIPDNNTVYNFIAGTLYTQMFQRLYDIADNEYNGPLPRAVRFFMDEFANIALPNDYTRILSTSRSRNVSFIIVLQDKQQIEAIFEKYYRTIYGNCAFYLFLGSMELETCKYYSELLGKETIVVTNWTRNYGRNGGSSKQIQLMARELKSPDELMRLDSKKCILYTHQGVVEDYKYDVRDHPLYHRIADKPGDTIYDWGSAPLVDQGGLTMMPADYRGVLTFPEKPENSELLDPEEIDRKLSLMKKR